VVLRELYEITEHLVATALGTVLFESLIRTKVTRRAPIVFNWVGAGGNLEAIYYLILKIML
jgi:hypothetical protein